MARGITQAMKRQFAANGAVKLPGFLDADQLAELRACFDWSFANNASPRFGLEDNDLPADAPPISQSQSTSEAFGFPAGTYNDNANPAAQPMYAELLPRMPFAEAAAELWESEHVWFINEELWAKTGGQCGRSPWHQDTSYMPFGGSCLATFWIPFESLPKENSLEMIRGSHLGPRYDAARYDDPDRPRAPVWGPSFGPPLPDVDANTLRDPDAWSVLSWKTQPGDVIVFHLGCLHGGAPVTPDCPERHTLALRFFGDDAYFAPVPKSLWPMENREPGDPAAGPEYIQLR